MPNSIGCKSYQWKGTKETKNIIFLLAKLALPENCLDKGTGKAGTRPWQAWGFGQLLHVLLPHPKIQQYTI